MLNIRNGPKVRINRGPGRGEIATIITLYRSENFQGYGLRRQDGSEVPIGKEDVTFIEREKQQ